MQWGPVNLLAIIGCVVSSFVIGGLWYSPLLFVNPWLRMSGVDRQAFNAGLPRALVGDFFSAVAISLALNQVIRWSGHSGLAAGLLVALGVWIGFVASVLLTQVTYERRPFAYFAISSGYRLVSIAAMGAILSIWR